MIVRCTFVLLICCFNGLRAEYAPTEYDEQFARCNRNTIVKTLLFGGGISGKEGGRDPDEPYTRFYHPQKDTKNKIVYPCRAHDLNCIRNFFASRGHCVASYGHVPEPIYKKRSVLYLIKYNTTIVLSNSKIWGLNEPVETFYVNEGTGNLVMAVNFRQIKQHNEVTDFYFHRVGKEPLLTTDFSNITYGPIIVTAVIPLKNGIDLHNAMITSYIFDGNPSYTVGPRVFENKDPIIQNVSLELISDPTTTVQEAIFSMDKYYFRTFIQHTICNFGISDD